MNIFTDEDIKEIVGPWGDTPIKGYTRSLFDKIEAKLREKRAEPAPEPVALTFAGLTVRELRIPAGMTVRIDRDALIVEPQRDPNDPILVEPNHDPSHAPYAALAEPQPQPVAKAWAEGYQQGVEDERTSEANIGIAGFAAKVKPARQNPYKTNPPQRQPLSDEDIARAVFPVMTQPGGPTLTDIARALERAHGIGGAT